MLRYIEGLSTEEIAQALEQPVGTVCSQLQRGRQRFERELWHYAEESGVVDPTPADREGWQSEEVDT